jgi:dimethyl sulfoxide reductase iron-sulfur subunit
VIQGARLSLHYRLDKGDRHMKRLSRREFFVGGAVVAAGAAAAAGLSKLPDSSRKDHEGHQPVDRQWAMVIDLRKCEGCTTIDEPPQCTAACQERHYLPEDQTWIKVFEMEHPQGGTFFMPRPCMQCENAPCLNVCPVAATYRDGTGNILVDQDRCIGCRMCMAACPYGARYFNWETPPAPPEQVVFAQRSPDYPVPQKRGTVGKCVFCAHETEYGRLPACAEGCPMNAIYFGDLLADVATNGKEIVVLSRFIGENSGFRFKEELGTRPRVSYIPGHGQEFGREAHG